MPRLPKKPLNKKKDSKFFNDLCEAISLLGSEREISNFLSELLTPYEKEIISKRLQIAVELAKGETYESIKNKLGVGDGKIAQVSNWISSGTLFLEKTAKTLIRRMKTPTAGSKESSEK